MKKLLLLLLLLLIGVSAATAQTQTANLGRCLADSTTGKDRKNIVKWIVVAMIQHPAMADVSTLSSAQIEQVNKTAAQVMVRLMTVDCRTELRAASKNGGEAAIGKAFETLGEVAMQEVMGDAQVKKALDSLTKYLDLTKIGQALVASTAHDPKRTTGSR